MNNSANDVVLGKHLESLASAAKNYTLALFNHSIAGGSTVLDTLPVTVNGGLWYELENNSPAIKIFYNGYAFNIADGTSQSISSGNSNPSDPYSQFLIVDSPFSSDLSDNCGVVWSTPSGTVSVSDGAAQFNYSYLRSTEQVTFGGQDFTISLDGFTNSRSNNYAALFSFQENLGTYEASRPGQFALCKNGSSYNGEVSAFNHSCSQIFYSTFPNYTDRQLNFILVYNHNNSTLRLFVDNSLTLTINTSFERLARYIWLGANSYAQGSQTIVGHISNFKVYDGVAIEP